MKQQSLTLYGKIVILVHMEIRDTLVSLQLPPISSTFTSIFHRLRGPPTMPLNFTATFNESPAVATVLFKEFSILLDLLVPLMAVESSVREFFLHFYFLV